MNFKQMILVDFLLNNFLKSVTKKDYQLVFELDGRIYTGIFAPKNNYGLPTIYEYKFWGYDINHHTFQSDKSQELRSAFFKHVFGENASTTQKLLEQYSENLQYLILNDVISVVLNTDPEQIFATNVEFPEVIQGLRNMENGTKFDHYIVTGRKFTPVSFIESTKDEWLQ